jgi:hypothetical protein
MPNLDTLPNILLTLFNLGLDALGFIRTSQRPRCALIAENLFPRKQLAMYLERRVKPRRAKTASKLALVWLPNLFAWREALTVVWTLQQFREVITGEKPYRFLIHDRDRIYSSEFDTAV